MRKLDKMAVVLFMAGILLMCQEEPLNVPVLLLGAALIGLAAAVELISEMLKRKRKAEEERNAQIKEEVFAAWLRNPLR